MSAPTEVRVEPGRPYAPESDTPPEPREPVSPGGPRKGRYVSAAIAASILVMVLGGYVAVGAALVRAAYDPMAGRPLTYDVLQQELDSALVFGTSYSLRNGIAAVEDSMYIIDRYGWTLVRFDTLAVLDTTVNPSLRPNGFLSDEVRRYNDAQRARLRRLAEGGNRRDFAGRRPTLVDLRERHNPSVFRSRLMFTLDSAGMGEKVVLAPRAVTTGMRVPSPFETRREVLITTREAPEKWAFLGARQSALLEGSGVTPGPAGCPFKAIGEGDTINVQCRLPGSARKEVLVSANENERLSTLTNTGQYAVHYDGERVLPGETVTLRPGGILRFPSRIIDRPAGAMALERTALGTLAGTQWVNGRSLWRHSPDWSTPFTRHLVGPAGFGATSAQASGRIIPLSLDEQLMRDVQTELEAFARSRRSVADLGFAVAVIANARTGEILGIAEIGDNEPDAPSRVFQAFNIGSAIKPLLTVSALVSFPELASLEIRNPGGSVEELWGRSLGQPFEVGSACPVGWIGLREFLACSSNLYSATLVAAALQPFESTRLAFEAGRAPPFRMGGRERSGRVRLPLDRRGGIQPETFNASALGHGLDSLFGITTGIEAAIADLSRDPSPWRGLSYHGGGEAHAPFGLWPERSRVGLVLQGQRATLRQLVGVALGAGEVRITPIHLTQSFGRIVTDRRLSLTFVPARDSLSVAAFEPIGLSRAPWYRSVRAGLSDVGEIGTGAGLGPAARRALGSDVVFYGKTGTLNTRPAVVRRRVVDTLWVDGEPRVVSGVQVDTIAAVAVKALTFGVGKPGTARGPALECGVVGTLYFRFGGDLHSVDDVARAFAQERLWRVLAEHWERLEICPGRARIVVAK